VVGFFSEDSGGNKMRILFAADLHGVVPLYRQLFILAKGTGVEIMALGGDLLPALRQKGDYQEMISRQEGFIEEFLRPFLKQCRGKTPAEQVLLIPGNWDMAFPRLLERLPEGVIDLTQRKYRAGGYEFIGYPFVPPTPFRPKDYEKMDDAEAPWPQQKYPSYIRSPEFEGRAIPLDPHIYLGQKGTIGEDLDRLPKPEDPRQAVYIMHSPPFETRLDLVARGSHAGSRAIRNFIERRQPWVTLHGHIHEAPEISGSYFDRIGRTLCLNPGQSPEEDRPLLRAVTFDLERPQKTLVHTFFRCKMEDEQHGGKKD
jgi:Icc-related predicted phosphoesterase